MKWVIRALLFVGLVACAYGAMVAVAIAVELVWPALILAAMLFAVWLVIRRAQ